MSLTAAKKSYEEECKNKIGEQAYHPAVFSGSTVSLAVEWCG
jgi:hypothetical protein